MVSCKLCKVTSGSRSTIGREKITFHRCPQKPELKKLWTDFLYLHLENSVSVNNFFLCSFHFEEKCFDRTSAQKVVLRPHSVPTISYTYEERITNVVTFRGNETHHTEVCDAPSVEPQQNIEDELSNKVFEITKKLENLTTKTCANVLLKQQINNLKTLVSQQQCTIKTLKRRTSKQQRKICNLKDVVSSLRKKINYYENNSVDVNKFQENTELLSRMWAKINNKPLPNQYGPEIRKFAVTTHFYSPKAFSFIRKQFMDCLPHPKTLSVWYSSVNGAPGFTMFDEVAIKRCIEYDGQQYYGYADMGSIIEVNENEEAKEALVFMLVAINGSWKIPVGYFLSHSLNSEQKLGLLKQCLFLVKSVGIEISNITFDGCATNLSMASALGCSFSPSNLKTNFGEENILLLLDPSHMMKLIRNTFGDKRRIVDGENNVIDFKYLELLNELQENEGLHLANKLRRRHINFFKQKMKVALATQLLSRSVSEALTFCRDILQLDQFKNCGATATLILNINDAFDILACLRKPFLIKFSLCLQL
ncbi:uncharacterized protein LOC135126865 isoform X2 [Zophobas morio]|uniref:uncharacterized protein LOC135126865 isoform X2 n=2 Tax=Zophobas morio TaxID=2755281 RepID=UPI00308380E1